MVTLLGLVITAPQIHSWHAIIAFSLQVRGCKRRNDLCICLSSGRVLIKPIIPQPQRRTPASQSVSLLCFLGEDAGRRSSSSSRRESELMPGTIFRLRSGIFYSHRFAILLLRSACSPSSLVLNVLLLFWYGPRISSPLLITGNARQELGLCLSRTATRTIQCESAWVAFGNNRWVLHVDWLTGGRAISARQRQIRFPILRYPAVRETHRRDLLLRHRFLVMRRRRRRFVDCKLKLTVGRGKEVWPLNPQSSDNRDLMEIHKK